MALLAIERPLLRLPLVLGEPGGASPVPGEQLDGRVDTLGHSAPV
ncbi:hypothetical protein [Cyanobium sp. N5-Cardenillas]|nr:hypothetical protein [Cyanobium sp. N5-Cardenillas]